MKKTVLLLIITILRLSICAQITTPVIKANFGVDGDLKAQFFNGISTPSSDDWFKYDTAGLGQQMIDSTGAAAIVAAYFSNPASRKSSFSRLMLPPFYSIIQKRLVIDAVYHRDFHGDDSTVFASGSNKNGMSPANWTCPPSQSIPDKNDILDAFTHIRRAGPHVYDSLWMLAGISIENTNGNRYFDFELYQTNFYYDRNSQTFAGYGPDAGHTAWQFDAAGNVLKAGDIIFSAEFSSSSLTNIEARIWINKNDLGITPINFIWGGAFDGASNGAQYGYASILPNTPGDFYSGLESPGSTWAGPFSLVRADNSVVTDYIPGQFMEFSINLSKLGIDPAEYSNNPCGTPFRRVMIKTRSSTSFTSELKDFIAPFSLFNFPKVKAYTNFLYFCKVFPLTTLTVFNPNPSSIYTWSTVNGNIVGSNIGTSIVVDKPGTYYVDQQLNIACPSTSRDTITLIFDSVCRVLNVDLLQFSAVRKNKDALLQWQATNNKDAAGYTIEYSLNGSDFTILDSIPANNLPGLADYSATFPLEKTDYNILYFRIKVTGRDGRTKYSNVVVLRNGNNAGSPVTLFPNPTRGNVWITFNSKISETVTITTRDVSGSLVKSTAVTVNPGDNVIPITHLNGKAPGVYLVNVKYSSGTVTQKVIKLN